MRCNFDHCTGIARRANPSAFAGKCDKKFLVTAFAVSKSKAFGQDAAPEIFVELIIDKVWNRVNAF
jgi:hypothetical protein